MSMKSKKSLCHSRKIYFVAPGAYCPEKVKLDKAPQYSFGLRTPIEKPNDTPGISSHKLPLYLYSLYYRCNIPIFSCLRCKFIIHRHHFLNQLLSK